MNLNTEGFYSKGGYETDKFTNFRVGTGFIKDSCDKNVSLLCGVHPFSLMPFSCSA